MMRDRLIVKLFGSVLLCGGLVAVSAMAQAQQVGRASAVRPNATQAAPGQQPATLALNAPIIRDAALDTSQSGALQVTFADNSKLTLGPNSNAVVDEFVYAGPSQSTSAQTIKYTKGVFRYVSGAMPKDKVRIESPAVTIGIRGTDVRHFIDASGGETVAVVSGIVALILRLNGTLIELKENQKIYIGPGGAPGPILEGTDLPCD